MDEQTAFVQALRRGGDVLGLRGVRPGLSVAEGLSAYRGNAQALSARALAAVFPRLEAELGSADFAAMAWAFWRTQPPLRGDLGTWGDALPAFLTETAGLDSGLPGLAQLEWARHEAERAADADLDTASLAQLAQCELEGLQLQLRPAVRLLALAGPVADEPALTGHCLVWREGWVAQHGPLDAATGGFMGAVLDGRSLAEALAAGEVKGLGAQPDFDFSAWLQAALRHEWLHRVVQRPT
ncbi:HvfC/BufC N-terminal domain-containing protein [Roseateles paludis]|uniref:DNA-binding domain-containing protein n=1 Tax=Roseateles paludis TaxID=3145238 RepID=A0ABV0G7U1_9BURK